MTKPPFFPAMLLLCLVMNSCGVTHTATQGKKVVNPPAPGFNLQGSDQQAISVADAVMQAMGGREEWDKARYIRWTFFGRRTLLWDKHAGRVRIDMPSENSVYIADIQKPGGKIFQNGQELTHPDSVKKYVDRALGAWINDFYWLLMPFKLKDSGVTLKYMGEKPDAAGNTCHQLQLTFQEVGRTPQNKYYVYVDKTSNLVSQWDYYTQVADESPRMSTPWTNYKLFGKILLSGDRGNNRQITDIGIFKSLPESVFSSFSTVDPATFTIADGKD